ncbi:MAG: AIM24 family protein [Nannocystaceae bacterium]|nr:AIM24 family protein [Nannocystaceae bacterium]
MPHLPPIPGVTEFAFGRLLNPGRDTPTLSLTADGHLMVTVRGEMMTRTEAVLLCSENLDIRAVNRRMQGRAVPEVFQRLVSLEGEGQLVLSREHERFLPLQLQRDLCFFVESYIWAMESTLMWDVGQLPRSGRTVSLVRIAGEGAVAVRVPGELVAVKIAPERPYRVHRSGFVGWVGNVVPHLEPDIGFLHCEGEGAVFVSLPTGPHPGGGRRPESGVLPAAGRAP